MLWTGPLFLAVPPPPFLTPTGHSGRHRLVGGALGDQPPPAPWAGQVRGGWRRLEVVSGG